MFWVVMFTTQNPDMGRVAETWCIGFGIPFLMLPLGGNSGTCIWELLLLSIGLYEVFRSFAGTFTMVQGELG